MCSCIYEVRSISDRIVCQANRVVHLLILHSEHVSVQTDELQLPNSSRPSVLISDLSPPGSLTFNLDRNLDLDRVRCTAGCQCCQRYIPTGGACQGQSSSPCASSQADRTTCSGVSVLLSEHSCCRTVRALVYFEISYLRLWN